MSDVMAELARYRAAEKDKREITGCLKAAATAVWELGVIIWWYPFATMIAFGIVHEHFPAVPALGFWEVFIVGLGLRWITGVTSFLNWKRLMEKRRRLEAKS